MLHKRINPTIRSKKGAPRVRKASKIQWQDKTQLPTGAPIWTLNNAARAFIGRSNAGVPNYDPSTTDPSSDDDSDNGDNGSNSGSIIVINSDDGDNGGDGDKGGDGGDGGDNSNKKKSKKRKRTKKDEKGKKPKKVKSSKLKTTRRKKK